MKAYDPSVQRRLTSPAVTERLSHPVCGSEADCGGRQQSDRLANDAAEIGLHLHTVHPALLDLVEKPLVARPRRKLAFDGMLVTAARIIEIHPAVIVPQYVGVDHRIAGIEHRTVIQVGKGTRRRIGNRHPDAERFEVAVRVMPPVGTEKQVIAAVAFIHFGRPEAVGSPCRGIAVVDDIALLPGNEVVRDADAKTPDVAARSVHIEFSVSGVEDERVAERNVERITICRRVASEQDRRQEEDEQFFHTGYLNGLNPS